MITVLVLTLIILIVLNVPIGVCLGLSSVFALMYQGNYDMVLVSQRFVRAMDSSTLLAIPLFIFAGKIMEKGGISQRIVDFAYSILGWIPGSLAIVTVVSCMFFAAISGSAPATVIAIGSIMVPIMIKDGYPASFSCALAAAGGCIGIIIPPSIPFVNYAVLTGVSISDMFVAGMIPGIFMGGVLAVYAVIMTIRHKWGKELVPFRIKNVAKNFVRSVLALLMPVIILGGIYTGYFTPTEAAAVACIYGIVVSCICYKETRLRDLPQIAYEGALSNGMIFLIIGTANIFSWILATEQVPAMLANAIMGITTSPLAVLMLINIIVLISGCFMETTAMTFIYVPILFPLAQSVGIDPIQFGIVFVVGIALGLLTPPLGVNLFLAKGISKEAQFGAICKAVIPMFLIWVVLLILFSCFPVLSTGLLS